MTIFAEDDIDTMLADWENELTAGGVTAACLLEEHDDMVLDESGAAPQVVRKITATILMSDFPELGANDAVTVDGTAYTVWRRLQLGDGALAELWLRGAA